MKALDLKLWRDLWNMRMQALAIALVITGGVGIFIMSLNMLDSLYETRRTYYRDHHFAQVFATLKRAPLSVAQQVQAIPGVDKVETRVVAQVNLVLPGVDYPVSGQVISLPSASPGLLNQVYLRAGRLLEHGRDAEVLLSEEFARAHGLRAGDTLGATINGRRRTLTVVGLALSPEHIYQIAPGAMFPDYHRYGVLWMARKPLAAAYGMDGAFNDVSLTLSEGADEQAVIDRLDTVLAAYGGIGAYGRKDQLSNRFLTEELRQQRTTATIFPVIFFGVAAFLLNVVVSRLVSLEREQIAALKAFGYSTLAVAAHYVKLVLAITLLGVALGTAAGVWMGRGMANIYMEFYSLPYMIQAQDPLVIAAAAGISMLLSALGTLSAVRRAARLPPAQAMRPEQPAHYRPTLVERLGLQGLLTQGARMILRHIERRPLKSALSLLGIAMACGVMMVGGFQESAIDYMVDLQYGMSQREDMVATFTEPVAQHSLYSLRSLPGVQHVEGFRVVPAELRFGHRSYRTSVHGIEQQGSLLRLLDTENRVIDIPDSGVILTDHLAGILGIEPGEMLEVEVLEGNRPNLEIPVAAVARQYLGVSAYMRREALNAALREGHALSGALLQVDSLALDDVHAVLRDMPRVAGVLEHRSSIRAFYETLAETVLFFTFITTLLGGSIAFGVVYNSVRIALSERSRELATLRVLGFQRSEVARILLGEMALLTLLAVPLGFVIGLGLCALLVARFESDLYRIPLVLQRDVYAFAATVVLGSALVSALFIWRNLGQLDMVAVLKTKV